MDVRLDVNCPFNSWLVERRSAGLCSLKAEPFLSRRQSPQQSKVTEIASIRCIFVFPLSSGTLLDVLVVTCNKEK